VAQRSELGFDATLNSQMQSATYIYAKLIWSHLNRDKMPFSGIQFGTKRKFMFTGQDRIKINEYK
jgi:hypothetical protein